MDGVVAGGAHLFGEVGALEADLAIERIAKANANKIQLENEAFQKYFKKEAQEYKKLEVAENCLKNGSKYVIDSRSKITNVISDVAGVVPLEKSSTASEPASSEPAKPVRRR